VEDDIEACKMIRSEEGDAVVANALLSNILQNLLRFCFLHAPANDPHTGSKRKGTSLLLQPAGSWQMRTPVRTVLSS
jgi:hypothetical protein